MRRLTLKVMIVLLMSLLVALSAAAQGKPTSVPPPTSLVASATPMPTQPSGVGGALEGMRQSTLPAPEACFVFTSAANTATLRVGPGTNRTSVAFLPANVNVVVTGRAVTDDGSVWYQLDKMQAAPRSAANEVWVAQGDVFEEGDCERVGETDAPPIIPAAPRAPAPGGGSGDSGGGGSAPAAGAVIPQSGTWRATYNSTTNASCRGGANVAVPSDELFLNLSFNVFLTVSADGNSFNDGGDIFRRAAGTNLFEGFWTFDDGLNAFVRMEAQSSTRMTGVSTINLTVSGTPCSATTAFTLSR